MKRNFEKFCKDYEKIENYEKAKADNFKGWDCHHRLETHNSDGERRPVDIPMEKLKALDMYYNRPPEELIFLRKGEHTALRKVSVETRNKIRESNKGKHSGEKNPMYGRRHTEESKKKLREAAKGNKNMLGKKHSEESKKKMREAHKGKKHSEESKKKIGAAHKGKTYAKGMHWFNNGKENKYCYECPDGFMPGRLKRK